MCIILSDQVHSLQLLSIRNLKNGKVLATDKKYILNTMAIHVRSKYMMKLLKKFCIFSEYVRTE